MSTPLSLRQYVRPVAERVALACALACLALLLASVRHIPFDRVRILHNGFEVTSAMLVGMTALTCFLLRLGNHESAPLL